MTKRAVWMCAVAAVAAAACAACLRATAAAQTDDLAAAPRISQPAFKSALASGAIRVIDVRDADSYAAGHIPGAESIPLDQLAMRVKELKASRRPIVTYCA